MQHAIMEHVDKKLKFGKQDDFACMHCQAVLTNLDNVQFHECLAGKNVFMDDNILFTTDPITLDDTLDELQNLESFLTEDTSRDEPSCSNDVLLIKQPAVWTNDATLALLSLYEANKNMLCHPKKKGKLWQVIADSLSECFAIEMSKDQVRWKIGSLLKRYKECIDNSNQTGRGSIEFEWFDQMEEIFGKQRDASATYTVSSGLCSPKKKNSAPLQKIPYKMERQNAFCARPTTSQVSSKDTRSSCVKDKPSCKIQSAPKVKPLGQSSAEPIAGTINTKKPDKRVRPAHGSGSNVARAKIEIEKQWLQRMEHMEKRDAARDERHAKIAERKKEEIQLKKKQLAMKEKSLELQRKIAEYRLDEKQKRHTEVIEIEKMKCQLLKKFLKQKAESDSQYASDTDS